MERKQMERMKDEMISAVSHEMRTPLTAMMGYTEFLLENPVDETQLKEYLGTIHKETERLKELITNFLDLQRMKAKQVIYCFKPLAVRPLLDDAAALFANASRIHRITVDASPDLPPVVGNEVGLHQVLNNLLSNAVKYSPKGGEIVLGARREGDAVIMWVRDEGIGMPPEVLEKIFEKLYQVEGGDRRSMRRRRSRTSAGPGHCHRPWRTGLGDKHAREGEHFLRFTAGRQGSASDPSTTWPC